MTLPNLLTLFRIFLVPVLVVLFYLDTGWSGVYAALTFSLAAITDWLDGYLSRRLDQESQFGAFLDPVADKLIVAVALVLLLEHFDDWWFAVPVCIIIGREITISALREWMASLGKRATVAVSGPGKWKTTFQMTAIIVLFFACSLVYLENQFLYQLFFWAGMIVLYLATLLTVVTLVQYLRAALPEVLSGD